MSAALDVALRGTSSRNVKKTSPEEINKIYAMKHLGTFEAKKTGVVNSVVKGTPGDNASVTLSVTISRPEKIDINAFQEYAEKTQWSCST